MTPFLPYPVMARELNRISIQVAEAGESGRPLVILLHGFPDLWQGWHYQMAALTAAGFRVLVPNQRGYGKSDKPAGILAYDVEHLATDVIALADSEGANTFSLIGHDWGGIVAWWVAARFPQRVARLMILNAPHPGIFQRYVARHPTQLLRSWYVGLFQIPWLPEAMLAVRDYQLLFWSVQRTSLPGVFDDSDRHYLIEGWSQPGALAAMLNYYRAIARRRSQSLHVRIEVPVLILFGRHDPTEQPGLAEASVDLCDAGRIVWFQKSRHWIQREHWAAVNQECIQFISDTA